MKKIILTIGICFISLMGVQAQQATSQSAPPTVEQQVDKTMGTFTSTCNLTADQQAKIRPILTQAITQKMENRQKYANDKTKYQEANKALFEDTKTKIYAILTADQQAKLIAYQNAKKAKMQKSTTASGNEK